MTFDDILKEHNYSNLDSTVFKCTVYFLLIWQKKNYKISIYMIEIINYHFKIIYNKINILLIIYNILLYCRIH